jgi:tetratricopeptide (TPR) repeat protein
MSALRRDTPAQASERSSRRGTSRGAGGQRGGGLRGRAWDWRGWLIAGLCAGVTASAQVAGAAESAASGAAGGAVAESEAASKTSTPPVYPLQCGGAAALRVVDAPRLPPPTPEQVRALRLLEEEAEGYLADAKRFQGTLTTIVRHHYEERRRRVLSTLDREIDMERKELLEARAEAIRRLEDFVARYSGANADPQATPDAMFRLAALYEERARDDYDADLTEGLRPAIDIYRSIVEQYPAYQESAAVHYYLGHALTDAGRLEEGQQAWRSLVCANRYQVTSAPASGGQGGDAQGTVLVQRLPQDHDRRFWNEWYNKNPVPLDQLGGPRASSSQLGVKEEELTFVDPYAGCEPLPQDLAPGDEPRYLAEIWWQIGNFHFDALGHGGPYALNRAVSAYDHALQFRKPPLYGVALYKQAWAYFKQQRYKTAVQAFVELLRYADEQEKKTGDAGADFRSEAYTYIAGSLTYVDFDGPPADDPNIPRSDVLDVELDPLIAEERMSVAIDRVQDPALIPQDQKWTSAIYKALAQEFIEISQHRNAIRALEITANKFPLDRDAPAIVNRIAELYDQLSRYAPDGSPARAEYAGRALSARMQLANYVGETVWTEANRDDPEALGAAEELVRVGLRRAAADHTNYARAYKDRALQLSDPQEQTRLLDKAIEEYRLAARGWQAYLDQDSTASDAYESRFWLADARFWSTVLQVPLGRSPTAEEAKLARDAAVAVRDSNEDDKYRQPAAYYVVTLAEKILEDEYRKYEETGGAQGIRQRSEVSFEGDGAERRVLRQELEPQVQLAVCARDEYNARIPLAEDPEKNGLLYAFQAADYFFLYGQFEEAARRFRPIYEEHCGKNEWGYRAWEKLISMSNFEGRADESRRLAEGRSCAYDEESRRAEESIRKPVKQGVAYLDARRLYEEAEQMPDGPERDGKWRAAAAAYKVALDAAPDRDEAPEAAMNGAYAYKQVGEYDRAIAMYRLFIERYGDDATLRRLRSGDPKAQPPQAADPAKYEERVGFLSGAYEALAGAYVLFFDYPKAAETFDHISGNDHFPAENRKSAALQALGLYANLDDTSGMQRVRKRLPTLGATAEELAEADFIIASAPLGKWDERSPQEGANRQARLAAEAAMEGYYERHRTQPAAAKFVVRAAYHMARAKRAVRSPTTNTWWKRTIESFERYRQVAPRQDGRSAALGSPEASMAAEADYTMLDAELKAKFDYESGFHRYKGTVVEVVKEYQNDAIEAKRWYDRLQHVVDAYLSQEWATVAIARQGSVYDSLRTGLYNTRPPELKMFTDAQERALRAAEESDNLDLQDKADEIRLSVQTAWRDKRDQELDSADQVAVDRYATAVILARRYNLSNAAVTRAIRRLAFLTDVVGEAKMAQFTAGKPELEYTPGMFQRMRPGVVTAPEPNGLPEPLPVSVR